MWALSDDEVPPLHMGRSRDKDSTPGSTPRRRDRDAGRDEARGEVLRGGDVVRAVEVVPGVAVVVHGLAVVAVAEEGAAELAPERRPGSIERVAARLRRQEPAELVGDDDDGVVLGLGDVVPLRVLLLLDLVGGESRQD